MILVTGGAGFVGANLSVLLKSKYPEYRIVALDNLKRRGSELNLTRLKEIGVEFCHGDIRNKEDLESVGEIDFLIEAAAEPSIMAGFNNSPDYVVNTNLTGTINCLNYIRNFNAKIIFLSTSRIYPIAQIEKINYQEAETRFLISREQELTGISELGISEEFSLQSSRSLYGATKLASEMMIEEFKALYGLGAVTNRCGVIAGPWQMGKVDQGVIALWLAKHYWKGKLSYLGYGGLGKQVRDAMHIADVFDLIDYEIHNFDKVDGEVFNAGGGKENTVSLLELTNICQEITGNTIEIGSVVETRFGDIRMYVTDNSKIIKHTCWKPKRSIQNIVSDTFTWIKENETELKSILA